MTRPRFDHRSSSLLHQSDETRVVSRKLIERLVELGESPRLFTDRPTDVQGIEVSRIFGSEGESSPEQIRRQAAESRAQGRLIFEVDAALDPARVAQGFQRGEQIFWFVTPSNWEASLDRLRKIQARAPGWRDKVYLVWLLRPEEQAPVASALRALAKRDFKVTLGQPVAHQGLVTVRRNRSPGAFTARYSNWHCARWRGRTRDGPPGCAQSFGKLRTCRRYACRH